MKSLLKLLDVIPLIIKNGEELYQGDYFSANTKFKLILLTNTHIQFFQCGTETTSSVQPRERYIIQASLWIKL